MQTQTMQDILDNKNNTIENPLRRALPLIWKIFKGLVSVGLLVWLAFRFDWSSSLAALYAVPWFITGLGLLLMILAQMFGARRLQLLLAAQEIEIGYFYTLRLTFAGLFAGNFLPSSVGGDAIKVLALARTGHGAGTPTASIVIDRVINLVAAAFLLPAVLFVPALIEPQIINTIGMNATGLLLGGVLLGGVLYLGRGPIIRRLQAIRPASALTNKIYGFFVSLLTIATRWATKPGLLLKALGLSWAALLSGIGTIWVASQGLGITASFIELTAIVILLYFVALLPISLNGLGIQEVSLVYMLGQLGATPEQALALAVFSRLFQVGTSLLGAFDILAWQRENDAHNE